MGERLARHKEGESAFLRENIRTVQDTLKNFAWPDIFDHTLARTYTSEQEEMDDKRRERELRSQRAQEFIGSEQEKMFGEKIEEYFLLLREYRENGGEISSKEELDIYHFCKWLMTRMIQLDQNRATGQFTYSYFPLSRPIRRWRAEGIAAREGLTSLSAQRAAYIDPVSADGMEILPGIVRADAIACAPKVDHCLEEMTDPALATQSRERSMPLLDLAIARQVGERMRDPKASSSTERIDRTVDVLKTLWNQRLPGMGEVIEFLRSSSHEAAGIVEGMQKELIHEPPSQQLKLVVVVPVRGEFKSGNLFRAIESFAEQKRGRGEVEILCAINMSTQESGGRFAAISEENTQALDVVNMLQGEPPASTLDSLNAYRQDVLRKVKECGLRVYAVDMSTCPLPETRLIGDIRNELTQEAMRRLRRADIGDQGIVLQWDADTIATRGVVDTLLAQQAKGKTREASAYFLTRDHVQPKAEAEVMQSTYSARFNYVRTELRATVKEASPRELASPQIAATVSAYEKIGGLQVSKAQEDFALTIALTREPNISYEILPEVRVLAGDRVHAYSDIGFDSSARGLALKGGAKPLFGQAVESLGKEAFGSGKKEYGPVVDIFIACAQEVLGEKRDRQLSPEVLEACAEQLSKISIQETPLALQNLFETLRTTKTDWEGVVADYLRGRGDAFDKKDADAQADEWIWLCRRMADAKENERLDACIAREIKRSNLQRQAQRRVVERFVAYVFSSPTPIDVAFLQQVAKPKMVEFAEQNLWMLDRLNALQEEAPTPEAAMDILTQEFPHQLQKESVGEVSNARRATARLFGVKAFFQNALMRPDEYPNTQSLIRMFSGKQFRE